MSDNDWWNGLYDDTGHVRTDERPLTNVSPKDSGTNTSGQRYVPDGAHTWGSGRTPDPFLTDHPAHTSASGDITPEEAAELKKHEKTHTPTEAETPEAPPMPTTPPTVGTTPKIALPAPGSTDGKDKVTGVKALLKVFKDTKSTTKNKTTAAAQKTGAATAPARATLRKAASAVSPANSGRWSFVWSMGAAWTLSFQTLIAVYDRAVSLIGAPQLMSGPQAMGWHLFEGPGHWFRDTLEYSWETGAAPRLFFLAAIGVLPIVVAQFAEKITSHTLRKIARLAGYGFPFIWACSHSYIDSFGFRTWDELYLSGLAASAWYFLTCSFGEDVTDFQKFIRRIPLASVVCGLIAYSPGAAF